MAPIASGNCGSRGAANPSPVRVCAERGVEIIVLAELGKRSGLPVCFI